MVLCHPRLCWKVGGQHETWNEELGKCFLRVSCPMVTVTLSKHIEATQRNLTNKSLSKGNPTKMLWILLREKQEALVQGLMVMESDHKARIKRRWSISRELSLAAMMARTHENCFLYCLPLAQDCHSILFEFVTLKLDNVEILSILWTPPKIKMSPKRDHFKKEAVIQPSFFEGQCYISWE